MHPFPHHYQVQVLGGPTDDIRLSSDGLPDLQTAAPREFDGPGGRWSPETLLVGAVADCFVLSFRAVATASKFQWTQLSVSVEGVLDRVDGVTRFTRFEIKPQLSVPSGTNRERANTILQKAERICLVSNSLSAEIVLLPEILEE